VAKDRKEWQKLNRAASPYLLLSRLLEKEEQVLWLTRSRIRIYYIQKLLPY